MVLLQSFYPEHVEGQPSDFLLPNSAFFLALHFSKKGLTSCFYSVVNVLHINILETIYEQSTIGKNF